MFSQYNNEDIQQIKEYQCPQMDEKAAMLMNLNEDQQLNKKLKYMLTKELTYIGKKNFGL